MAPALVLSLALAASFLAAPAAATAAHDGTNTFRTAEGCWQRLPLEGEALADRQPLPVGALVPCPGIRPGAYVLINDASGCTLNFVLRGTSYDEEGRPVDEGLFIGTAGHCALDGDGEHVWAPGAGPPADDASDRRFGEVAYAVLLGATPDSPNWDIALIRVDDDREPEVNPALCHFGGPSGLSPTWGQGDVVHHFGQGLVYGETVQGRSGVTAFEEGAGSAITFAGAALFGDSGSPLIEADGDALGVVTAILPPLVFATPLAEQIERAETQLDMDLDLVQATFA